MVVWYAVSFFGSENGPGGATGLESFAQCLTENDAVMYGAYWCGHCKQQKEDFGDAFALINYVECTEETETCTAAGIQGFPTWIIDGELFPGRQSFERLASLTGCSLS